VLVPIVIGLSAWGPMGIQFCHVTEVFDATIVILMCPEVFKVIGKGWFCYENLTVSLEMSVWSIADGSLSHPAVTVPVVDINSRHNTPV
jgi:hypothetical protein